MQKEPDYQQPAAYDVQGRPLYLHPPTTKTKGATPHEAVGVVQVTRSTDPIAVTVSAEMARRHKDSMRQYPFLNLTDGEYVVRNIKRHPAGITFIWLATSLLSSLVATVWWFLLAHPGSTSSFVGEDNVVAVSMFAGGLVVLTGLFGWVAATVYKGNKFFLTNESVIQEIQTSLLSTKEQTINLENIKDVSYHQAGIIQQLVGYGSIKLSTEGDDQEYDFTLVSDPKRQVAIINNVVEAVKYGRPIDEAIKNI